MDLFNKKKIPYGVITGSFEFPGNEYPVVYQIDNRMMNDSIYNMTTSISIIIAQIGAFLKNNTKYTRAIVHADRFENLGAAIAFSYCGLKLYHTEGGEDTGCIDDKVRNSISALADIHLVTSEEARRKLLRMGKDNIHVVGSIALDQVSVFLKTMSMPPGGGYILVLYHPVTDGYEDHRPFVEAMKTLAKKYRIIWIEPNGDPGSRKIIDSIKELKDINIDFIKTANSYAYLTMLYNCACLVGNTSSGIKEGGFMGVPYIMYGDRQKNREVDSNVIRVRTYDSIIEEVERYVGPFEPLRFTYGKIWGEGNAAEKVIEILGQ